jgi:hypothetical protein
MIPSHTKAALDRYVNERIIPGDFLFAVLSNDLFNAIERADRVNMFMNITAMREIVEYIYTELPSNSWGDRKTVLEYLANR